MYTKDLTKVLQLRLSKEDYEFLLQLGYLHKTTLSGVARLVIREYKEKLHNQVLNTEGTESSLDSPNVYYN